MGSAALVPERESAWNPGVGPGIAREFRALENIFRAECALTAAEMAVAANCGFLRESVRRIAKVDVAVRDSGIAYLRARQGRFEVLDAAVLARVLGAPQVAAALGEIAPGIAAAIAASGPCQTASGQV